MPLPGRPQTKCPVSLPLICTPPPFLFGVSPCSQSPLYSPLSFALLPIIFSSTVFIFLPHGPFLPHLGLALGINTIINATTGLCVVAKTSALQSLRECTQPAASMQCHCLLILGPALCYLLLDSVHFGERRLGSDSTPPFLIWGLNGIIWHIVVT